MSDIEKLKSLISKKGGIAPANRFNVVFTPPKRSLLNFDLGNLIGSLLSNTFDSSNFLNDPRDISLLCQSVDLPGRQITTIDYIAEKQQVPIPYTVINEDVTMKFLMTNDYAMKNMFDNWISGVIDMDSYTVGYKKDFTTDVIIQQLNQNNIPVYGVKLENAFPTTLSSIALDSTSENTISELTVTLSYDNYIPQDPVSSSLGAVKEGLRILNNII